MNTVKTRKVGNSLTVTIPKNLGMTEGQEMVVYKGIDGKMGVSEISDGKTTVINDALYEEDSFHPNNTGYEKMKQAILEKINATKKTWSQK